MAVTENEEAKQVSNSDLSNTSSNAKCDSNERSYDHQQDTNLHNQNRNTANKTNFLLLDANQVQPEILFEGNQIKTQKANGLRNKDDKRKCDSKDLEAGPLNGEYDPPDGGIRAWSIMIGSFIINGVLFSVINSYSIIYGDLNNRLQKAGVNDTASKACKFYSK